MKRSNFWGRGLNHAAPLPFLSTSLAERNATHQGCPGIGATVRMGVKETSHSWATMRQTSRLQWVLRLSKTQSNPLISGKRPATWPR